jgi:hypothetical protein
VKTPEEIDHELDFEEVILLFSYILPLVAISTQGQQKSIEGPPVSKV